MSNLKNLTDKILENGKQEAEIIKEKSDETNKEIINAKTSEAREKSDKITRQANLEASMIKNRLKSEADLKIRDKKLQAKRQVLDKAFNLAKNSLKNIDEDRYMNFLKNNLDEISLKGSEVLILPEKFKDKVKESSININISENESVESGFLVRDGNVSINFTFDSLVDFVKEDLEAEVAQILFEVKE